MMHVRVCPECDEEYRPEITTCADCGATLEDRYEDEDGPDRQHHGGEVVGDPAVRGADPTPPVPDEYRWLFTGDNARDIEPLAERLGQKGIAFQVRTLPRGGGVMGFQLWVRVQDRAEALRQLDDLLPAMGRPAEYLGEESAPAPAAPCPACGTEMAPGAAECPDCGLVVRDPEPVCESCSRPLERDAPSCTYCGRRVLG